ncbi:CpaF family protein [Magnetospirillum sp. UT-4]|uniref:CpaF family protein n=1 Tax=Magnetospirillum sp. UT-4 TaxID=2681467 RepID=UPI0013813C77|nr:CpaF family protein [Magnetospirillum sp. UT-4]CAA7615382.1 Type II/IV secretion system ATP hydrolase TadA/VirB11/CpaF, TadA subfamily [Magnetospirillum sp. UT-4]
MSTPVTTSRFAAAAPPRPAFEAPAEADTMLALKVRLHQQLLDTMNLGAIETMAHDQFVREVGELVRSLMARDPVPLNHREKTQLVDDILDEVLGLGPLEPLLKDPTISDILVNTHQQVVVERRGRLEPTAVRFKDERHLQRIVNKIVSAVGRRVHEAQPLVDARLPDGSRVNVAIPPVAVDGTLVSIRKFSRTPLGTRQMIESGSLSPAMARVLEAAVRGRLNLVVSGGTGSGKTTLLNALSAAIDPRERIVTIEDAAELQLQQPHVARLETRPPNIEGRGEITQRDLVRNALRMRPDRIILGEVRAGEAFDMLQAMNTGHDGSMSSVHANTPRDALARLEQMVGMAGIDMPPRAVRAQIASAVDLVVQVERMVDGGRRVVSVQEVTGIEGDIITIQEIFLFRRRTTGADGRVVGEFLASGIRPRFCADLAARGVPLGEDLFTPGTPS